MFRSFDINIVNVTPLNRSVVLQVKREATGDSWFVIRRYSHFLDFYRNLPRSFTAITPPLPPKSWRSLSFLSMTPVSRIPY